MKLTTNLGGERKKEIRKLWKKLVQEVKTELFVISRTRSASQEARGIDHVSINTNMREKKG